MSDMMEPSQLSYSTLSQFGKLVSDAKKAIQANDKAHALVLLDEMSAKFQAIRAVSSRLIPKEKA